MGLELLEHKDLCFYCNCSKDRVRKAVASVGLKALGEMIKDNKDIEVNCHFCNTNYTFTPLDLKQMVAERVSKLHILE